MRYLKIITARVEQRIEQDAKELRNVFLAFRGSGI